MSPSSAEPDSLPPTEAAPDQSSTAESTTLDAATNQATAVPLQPWERLVEVALDAVLIADDAGYYVGANPAACQLLELPREALIGRRAADFLPPGIDDFESVWQSFLTAGQARGELQLYLHNGTIKEVEFTATAHVYPNRHFSILRDVTDRKRDQVERAALAQQLRQAEAALRSQQHRIDSILNSLEWVVWSAHPETLAMIYINTAAEAIYGYGPEAFLATPNLWLDLIYPDDRPSLMADLQRLDQTGRAEREYRIVCASGEIRWVRSQFHLGRDQEGNALRLDGTTIDISDRARLEAERKQTELTLKETQVTQQAILEAIPDLLLRINRDGQILNLVSGGEINLYSPLVPNQIQSVYQDFPKDLADQRMYYVHRALETGITQRYEHALEMKGKLHYEESRVVAINDTEVLVIVRDITERKQAEVTQAELNQKLQIVNTELNRLATIDGLTQIANRRSFDQALDLEWQRARRQQQLISLILCDIDYFKPYNDNYGHLAGDDCLRQVAQVLSSVVRRPGDMAARYGGEEFVLLLPDTTIQGAIQIVKQVQAVMAERQLPHAHSKISPILTLSFGLVCQRPAVKEHSPRELIHQADLALYEAKAQGRNRYVVR